MNFRITKFLNLILALTFMVTGFSKLAAIPPSPENFARWGFPPAFMYAIGAIEVLGGAGLLFRPVAGGAALLLAGTMLGAIRTGVVSGELLHVILPAVLLVLLALVFGARRRRP